MARDSSYYADRRTGGPLALLGEAIAGGAGDWSALEREKRLRQELIAQRQEEIAAERAFQQGIRQEERGYQSRVRAEEAQRQKERIEADQKFQTEWRKGGWEQEKLVYETRRYDELKKQLMMEGHLAPEDVDKPDAFKAAMEKGGPISKELAEYKASIPHLIAASKGDKATTAALASILKMRQADIAQAREIMEGAYAKVGETISTEATNKENNLKNSALLMVSQFGKITGLSNQGAEIDDEIVRLASPAPLTDEENATIRASAMGKILPEYQKAYQAGNPSPKAKAALAEAMTNAEKDYRLTTTFNLQNRAKTLDSRMRTANSLFDGLKAASAGGQAAYMDLKELGKALGLPGEDTGTTPTARTATRAPTSSSPTGKLTMGGFTKAIAGAPPEAPAAVGAEAAPPVLPATTTTAAPGLDAAPVLPAVPPAVPPAAVAPTALDAIPAAAVLPTPADPAAAPAWWSPERDPEANRQAVINAVRGIPGDIASVPGRAFNAAANVAQFANPANWRNVPGAGGRTMTVYAPDQRLPDMTPAPNLMPSMPAPTPLPAAVPMAAPIPLPRPIPMQPLALGYETSPAGIDVEALVRRGPPYSESEIRALNARNAGGRTGLQSDISRLQSAGRWLGL